MAIDTQNVVTVVAVVAAGLALCACTVLGSGRSTLVLADPPATSVYAGTEFRHLISDPASGRKLVGLGGNAAASDADWRKFQDMRLGGLGNDAAQIGINVRDQTNTPPLDLFNIETVTAADLAKVITDKTMSAEQKDAMLTQLRDNFRGMPETYSRLVTHGISDGGLVYYYFPQVTIDLTGTLNSGEPLDRFDFLAAAIRIPPGVEARFINFSPKAADLFDFTLGQLKQTASATATANAANKVTVGNSSANKPEGGPETSRTTGGELGYGGSASFTLSDELTRDMKSSLEARSAGILDGGKLFLIELRSNEQKHIAGTYSFNVMLEVPSKVTKSKDGAQTFWTSVPDVKSILAQVRVVGVVRHVVRPGRTGTFKRVPEPLNDTTFRQVVLRDGTAPLWEFTNVPTAQVATQDNLTVYTNADGASFTVYDEKTDAVLAHGAGREARFAVSTPNTVKVVFHPSIVGGDKPVALKAGDASGIKPGANATAIGNYTP